MTPTRRSNALRPTVSFEKGAEAAASRPLAALEEAQELAYDAMEATGRLRLKLLTVSPECAYEPSPT
jgi:hypothetical protein